MKGWGLAALAAVLMFAAPSVAGAVGPVELGIGGGFNMPVGDTDEAFETGFHVRGIVGFQPPALPMSLRGALGYEKMDVLSEFTSFANTANILSGVAGMKMHLLGVGPVKPYVTAGLGAFSIHVDTETGDSDSQVKFGIDGGVGVDLRLGGIGAFVEARMQNIFTDEGWNPAVTNSSALTAVPVTFGLTF